MKLASPLVVALVLSGGVVGASVTRPKLARVAHDVKQRDDVYVLPPPAQLRRMTLGYHAAAVDALWAKLLVDYGTHWHDMRPFPDVPKYLDAILALEPDYAPLYKFADTFLIYRPPVGTADDARLARHYLALGLQNRPRDHRVWTYYGEFLAFMAPSFLKDAEEIDQWRHDGAEAILQAVELGASADRSVGAAAVFNKAGEVDVAIRSLERAWNLTEDESERERIAQKITALRGESRALEGEAVLDRARRNIGYIESIRKDFLFMKKLRFLLLFPETDVARCVGVRSSWFEIDGLTPEERGPGGGADVRECARSWDPRLPSARTR